MAHAWLVDPEAHTLEAFERSLDHALTRAQANFEGGAVVRT